MNKMVKMLWSSVTKFAENKPTSLKKVRLVLFEEKLVSEVQQEILTVSETFQFANDEKTTCFQDCEVHGEHKNKIQVVKQLTQYLKCTKSVHLPCLIDLNVNQVGSSSYDSLLMMDHLD